MKKHWKKIVLVLGLIFLSVAGYLVYLFQFKEYDVADEEVTEITREAYEIELPDGSVIIIDEDGNVIEKSAAENGESDTGADGSDSSTDVAEGTEGSDGTTDGASGDSSGGGTDGSGTTAPSSGTAGSSAGGASGSGNSGSGTGSDSNGSSGSDGTGSGSDGSAGNGSGGNGSGGNGSGGNGGSGNVGSGNGSGGSATVAQIKQRYEPTMANIEDQANGRINSLIGRAKAEYSAKQAAGESISYPYFYNKYYGAATDLEERTDQAFYAVLGAMKKELKANGLAESHADTLVSEYESRKEARKSSLLKQATGF